MYANQPHRCYPIKNFLNSLILQRSMPELAASQFAALLRNSSASYKADHNEVFPTKVGGSITSLACGKILEKD